jgi:hypothetical protein
LLLKDYHFDDQTALWKNIKSTTLHINTLKEFDALKRANKPNEPINRKAEQSQYFVMADDIAGKAALSWPSLPLQTYHYNQVENPLRWYTLAQDIKL